jgi:hypothetical protein
MRHSPLSIRLLLAIWTCAFLLGLVLGGSRAAASYPDCGSICESLCQTHDGCDDSFPDVGVCYYWCMDGYNGEVVMGK